MCEYCEKSKKLCENEREELGMEMNVKAKELVAYGLDKKGWNISVNCKINFCPMCGKKLGEKNESVEN